MNMQFNRPTCENVEKISNWKMKEKKNIVSNCFERFDIIFER